VCRRIINSDLAAQPSTIPLSQPGAPILLQGVSVWGEQIPNAWLGALKNVDLVQERELHISLKD
jgi:hypothetical protein